MATKVNTHPPMLDELFESINNSMDWNSVAIGNL